MRLRNLSLDRFGRFAGKTYDFGPASASGDFHVIYGPNEAGKTTTMEGFLRLLYGFPHQDSYGFQHQRKNLSISGTLEIGDQTRHFTRLPQRDGALTDENGVAPPENAMAGILGGLDETEYRKLLCLDDETIEKGGEEIASSKGDIGRLLFSAAAGISDLTAVLDQVQSEADDLHRARASKTRFAILKKEREALDKQIKELDVPASAYRKLKQALEAAQSEEQDLVGKRAKLRSARADAETLANALPMLSEVDRLSALLVGTDDYPTQLDINPEELVGLIEEQSKHTSRIDTAEQALAKARVDLEAIERHPEYLPLIDALQALEELRSRHLGALRDLDRRRSENADITAEMTSIARQLGATPDGLDALLIDEGTMTTIEGARTALRDARRQAEGTTGDLQALQDRQRALHSQAPVTSDEATDWTAFLEQYGADRLLTAHATARHSVAQAQRTYSDSLAALTIADQQFDTAPTVPIASDAAEALADRVRDLRHDLSELQKTAADHDSDIAAKTARIDQLRDGGGVIGDDAASALKQERDTLWSMHLQVLNAQSAQDFAAAMQAVDDAADKRLSHARDLGELRQVEADLAEAKARRTGTGNALVQAQTDHDAAIAEAETVCQHAGLREALDPASLPKWIKAAEAARAAQHSLELVRAEQADTLNRAETLTQVIAQAAALVSPTLDDAVDTARRKAASQQKDREAKQNHAAEMRSVTTEIRHREATVQAAQDALSAAEARWRDLIASSFAGHIAPEALENGLTPLQSLREDDIKRQQFSRQINGMTEDQALYLAKLQDLATQHALPEETNADALHQSLSALAAQAQAAEERFAQLSEQMRQLEENKAAARAELTQIERRVADLAAIFPASIETQTLADLRRAVATTEKVLEQRETLSRSKHALTDKLRVNNLAQARDCLKGHTAETLEDQIDQLGRDIDDVDTALSTASAERGRAEHALKAVTGDSDIALLTEQKAIIELEIQEVARRHLELRLGHRLAEEAIRRYRDTHRSGMMQAAEATFATLTNGAYVRLDTVPSGQSETLIAYDAAGQAKQAKDMSKGTRFQLYLALRAAAYDQLAAQGQTLPFFCDDIFETFDEDRTRSACQVMARIGQTGQAIYLTHHKHVVDLAQEVCGGAVTVHSI